MLDLLLQLLGGLFLLLGLFLGYRRWLRPRMDGPAGLGMQAVGLLGLLILTFMGGFIGSPFWWLDEARSFAWDLPPLASRMLAAAGWSFAVVSFLALEQPRYPRVRLVLWLLAVYLTPLVAVIVLFHLDRFDFASLITYGFFAIAIPMTLAALWYLMRQPTVVPGERHAGPPPRPILRMWLLVLTAVSGAWGAALFITERGPWPLVWAWPGDALSSRLIGVMLLAIAAGALYARRDGDAARLMLLTTVVYGLGLAVASLWNATIGRPVQPAYVVVFGLMGLVSAAILALTAGSRLAPQLTQPG